ncbi:hypothetical protein ACFQ0I_16025 [Mariniflexile aquimaris]|uniref:WD40 repeat protein n=1 Tax=Mariniflexile aquimaris TaxID=881009 RepID=A0ABW3BWG9_9FLAO
MTKFFLTTLSLLFLAAGCVSTVPQGNNASTEEAQVVGSVKSERSLAKNITILKSDGGRVAWSPDGKTIYLDRKDSKRYFDIYKMNPDGSNETCLTCNTNDAVPSGHNGQPAIHPNGELLVFQAQKKEHVGNPGRDKAAEPGLGRYHDLWLLNLKTNHFYQLTNLEDAHNTGILHPHFSKDGKKLTWSQMYNSEKNYWTLKMADFTVDNLGKPHLSNIETFAPGGEGFYENHGLSSDGKTIIFTGNFELTSNPFSFFKQKIYTYAFETKKLVALATERYNESAEYSPIGNKIVWFTSVGNNNRGTDYWSMNYDGSGKKRITDFNNPKISSFKGKVITAADKSFSPDGKYMVAYLQTNLISQDGMTVLIELDDDWYK